MKSPALRAVVMLGIVSLLGDIIYEGSRGLIPEYLRFLGASALVVGTVMGAGELVSYAVRLASGVLADTTRRYWGLTFLGYGLIIGIPLLALAHSWQLALAFILVERLGKAIRTPARDVILAAASRGIGKGKAFGIHEFMDQLGAVTGPLIVAGLVWGTGSDFSLVFGALLVPYLVMLASLIRAKRNIGEIGWERKERKAKVGAGAFVTYTAAVGLNTLGLIPAALILYKTAGMVAAAWIVPLVYALIQIVDAPVALLAGYAYDRVGRRMLLLPFALAVVPSVLVLASESIGVILVAAMVFGAVLGMQESIYRAAVAELVPAEKRGRAYGVFHTVYGVALLGAGAMFGWMLDAGAGLAVGLPYVCGVQITAILLLVRTL